MPFAVSRCKDDGSRLRDETTVDGSVAMTIFLLKHVRRSVLPSISISVHICS
jgi:hypothetical protein